jgi:dTDP-4-amino-4,6-dideoxygalactose transaminase
MNEIKIPLLTPQLPDREALWPYLDQIDVKKHYSNFGPLVKLLESRLLAQFQSHTPLPLHVTTVSSATLGLELALTALHLPKGSSVLVPALTFVASLTAIIRAGYIPVVTDIDADSWLLTPEIASAAAKQCGAKAVLAVATFGQPQDTSQWLEFQHTTGLRVVIDAAGAFGSQWLHVPDIPVVFSMHATKSLAAGEGGFVVSGNPQMATLIAQMSNFGINLSPRADIPVGYLLSAGTNAKLSEYHAAVGLASLDQWSQVAAKRQLIYAQYRECLSLKCGEALTWQAGFPTLAPTTFSVRVGSSARRDRLESMCLQEGIATRRWYQPLLHLHAKKVGRINHLATPIAENVAADLIGLPFSISLTAVQMEIIADIIHKAI